MNNTEPLFKPVFGQQWAMLPEIIQKRYANRPYSNDIITVEGKLDVYCSPIMNFFMPFFRLFKVLVPYQGKNIPVIVSFRSKPNSSSIYFERTFYFPNKKPYHFNSYLQPIKENDVVEFVCLGLGWRMKCIYENEKVLQQHKGYVCKIFGILIPVPFSILMGKIYAEETATSHNSFAMLMKISHPLFGKLFEYSGEFTLVSSQ